MSRCEELKEVFGDHFICSQCDKGLSLGDILILDNRPHKIVYVYRRGINNIPLYALDYIPADGSIAEKAYENC